MGKSLVVNGPCDVLWLALLHRFKASCCCVMGRNNKQVVMEHETVLSTTPTHSMHVNIWADWMLATFEASQVLLYEEFQTFI